LDKHFTFNPFYSGMIEEKFFQFYSPLAFGTDYSRGNAGTIADIESNAIYVVGLSNNISGSTNPYMSFSALLKYTDD